MHLFAVAIAAFSIGCSGSAAQEESQDTIDGDYSFTKSYLSNSCGEDRELVDQSAVVTRGDSGRFTLDDGVVAFAGTVEPDGSFVTDPFSGQDANNNTLTVVLEGTFRTDGFDATLRVDQVGPAGSPATANCDYSIRWTGTRVEAAAVDA